VTADAPSPDVETVLAEALARTDLDWPGAWCRRVAAHLAAALRGAGLPEPSGVTVTEWGVRLPGGFVFTKHEGQPMTEKRARAEVGAEPWKATPTLVSRQRTTYPDRVTDWQEATP
jgi:hypothetical protein